MHRKKCDFVIKKRQHDAPKSDRKPFKATTDYSNKARRLKQSLR